MGHTQIVKIRKPLLFVMLLNTFDEEAEAILATEIVAMVRMYLKPRLIFDRCLDFLIRQRFQVPSPRTLTDMVRAGSQGRKEELVTVMESHLTEHARHLSSAYGLPS